jgi:hypothetical protein
MEIENEKLKVELKELENENKILRRQIDEIYRCWLIESNQNKKLKEEIKEIKTKLVSKNSDNYN